jgi:hypothetical protein
LLKFRVAPAILERADKWLADDVAKAPEAPAIDPEDPRRMNRRRCGYLDKPADKN